MLSTDRLHQSDECVRTKKKLQWALQGSDPHEVAAALKLFPFNTERGEGAGHCKRVKFEDSMVISVADTSFGDGSGAGPFDWSTVLNGLHEANHYAVRGDSAACFEAQANLHTAFNHVFASSQGNWLVPALHTICEETHRTAILADATSEGGRGRNKRKAVGGSNERLENAVNLLQESFSKTLNDRKELKPNAPPGRDGSKKTGVLFIVNQLFSMYFRLNKLRLCKNLLRPVERDGLHEKGTMSEMVTYRYYVGRINTFEDQYGDAEQNLDFALQHCHKDAVKNKRRILNYLLPVKLLRGRLPTSKLLEKYSLHEFRPIVEGIRTGNLRAFTDGMMASQDIFIRRGTYLLLEKCKTVCHRNLFKRVYHIFGETQMKLDWITDSFHWLGADIDLDEAECILANLIYRGFVKGYISHSNRKLVLSKRDPFPVAAVIKP